MRGALAITAPPPSTVTLRESWLSSTRQRAPAPLPARALPGHASFLADTQRGERARQGTKLGSTVSPMGACRSVRGALGPHFQDPHR